MQEILIIATQVDTHRGHILINCAVSEMLEGHCLNRTALGGYVDLTVIYFLFLCRFSQFYVFCFAFY